MDKKPTAQDLKELGNSAVKNGKHEEAVLHYTLAIKLEPTNFTLYSNRSYAFLKMQMYHFALEDAKETIKLNPTGAKGYFRKGEVEFATSHYPEAVKSYEASLSFKPDDTDIASAIRRAKYEFLKDVKANEQIPWVGSGIGIILGVAVVLLDYFYTTKPTHPVLMAVVTIAISLAGFGIAKVMRYYTICKRNSLLQPPDELWDNNEMESKEENCKTKSKTNVRFTKSQARQRYKKNKLSI